MDGTSTGSISYRLTNIEKSLDELKDLIIEIRLQRKDIDELQQSIRENKETLQFYDTRIRNLEMLPLKEKSTKWEHYIKTFAEIILSAGVLFILARIGLK